jgi:hypothetical protein
VPFFSKLPDNGRQLPRMMAIESAATEAYQPMALFSTFLERFQQGLYPSVLRPEHVVFCDFPP